MKIKSSCHLWKFFDQCRFESFYSLI